MKIREYLDEQFLKNITEVQKKIDTKEYDFKISQALKIFKGSITKEDIIKEVKSSKIAALYFAKNPLKQNITEPLILSMLKKYNSSFKKVSTNSYDSIRFNEAGEIIYGKKPKNCINLSKSVDYEAVINGKIYYFAQKYTTGQGGAQDNQYNDAVYFVNCGLANKNRTYGLGMILDGDYYDSKLESLKSEYSKYDDVLILSVENDLNTNI